MRAAPSKPDVLSTRLGQRLVAGEANRTSGFKVVLNSTPDMVRAAGSAGKLPRSSRPERARPTASGAGAQDSEILSTVSIVASNPLMISSVRKYDDQA